MIRIENLNKYYNKGKSGELHVIANTSLTFGDTGLVCILGESGSGKTTLMNTMSGLDDFADGWIDVDGEKIEKFGSKKQERIRNEKFGYIFQNYYLLLNRTVEYNLLLALSMYEMTEEEKQERIEYVLKAVDMWRYKKRLVSQLSGGQQQRIAIARALAKSPAVIFADEPTGNLDEANTMNIMGILKKVSENCLVVVVTHEKEIAELFADRILWIEDGKIKKDEENKSHSVYHYIDDTNLYLGEYQKTELENGNAGIEIYDNGEKHKIEIKMVYENGKIFLSAEGDCEVEYLTSASEKKVIDSERPVVSQSEMGKKDYILEAPGKIGKANLSRREIREIARSSNKNMGKRKWLLAVTFFVLAVLMTICVQQVMSAFHVDREEVVKTDSHYYQLSAKANGYMSTKEMQMAFLQMVDALKEQGYDVCIQPKTSFTYQYTGFRQLENYTLDLPECSVVSSGYLEEKTLVYGKMPEKLTDVVLDVWVVRKFQQESNEAKSLITSPEQMVGNTIMTTQGMKLTITGISDSGEPDIYMSSQAMAVLGSSSMEYLPEFVAEETVEGYERRNLSADSEETQVLVPSGTLQNEYRKSLKKKYADLLDAYAQYTRLQGWYKDIDSWSAWGYTQREIREMKKDYEDAEQELHEAEGRAGITIEEYQALYSSETEYLQYSYTGTLNGSMNYKVVGAFSGDIGVKFIIADDAIEQIAQNQMGVYCTCSVYDNANGDALKNIQEIAESADSAGEMKVSVTNLSKEDITSARADGKKKFDAIILVVVTIAMISLLMIYFMMKSYAIAGMQDIGVYRLLGISKRDIKSIYAYGNYFLSCYTTLPAVLLTSGILIALSKVEGFGISVFLPWYAIVGTVVILFLCNIVAGVLPIRKMLKLPPAQLAAKYDI